MTGSYIEGSVEDAVLPVTVIDRDALERQGSPAILDVMRSLSASQGTVGESNPGGVLLGTGAVSVNLRGFDGGRTLVLFNGRRLPVSPVALLGVDVNLLPLGAVERIEVLKDGAAATYGSDAIAGVVNFISRRGFEGLSIDGSYSSIEDSDGDYSTNLLWGHKSDTYDVLLSAGYRHRSELHAADRDFAIPPFDRNIAAQGGFSASGSPGAFVIPPLTAIPNIFIDPGCEALGGGIRATGGLPQCQFRFSQYQNLIDRQEELQLYGELNTRLGDVAELHVEGYYSFHDVPEENTAASFPPTQGPGATTQMRLGLPVDPTNSPTYIVPLNNPGLQALLPSLTPAQANAITAARAVAASGLLFRPLGPGGNPLFENEGVQREIFADSFRFSSALDGEVANVGWNVAVYLRREPSAHSRAGHPGRQSAAGACRLRWRELHGQHSGGQRLPLLESILDRRCDERRDGPGESTARYGRHVRSGDREQPRSDRFHLRHAGLGRHEHVAGRRFRAERGYAVAAAGRHCELGARRAVSRRRART